MAKVNAFDIAELVQISIEDDVDEVVGARGNDKRAHVNIIKNDRSFKISVLRVDIPEDEDDDEEEDEEGDAVTDLDDPEEFSEPD